MRLRRGKFLKAKPIKYFHRCKPTYIYYSCGGFGKQIQALYLNSTRRRLSLPLLSSFFWPATPPIRGSTARIIPYTVSQSYIQVCKTEYNVFVCKYIGFVCTQCHFWTYTKSSEASPQHGYLSALYLITTQRLQKTEKAGVWTLIRRADWISFISAFAFCLQKLLGWKGRRWTSLGEMVSNARVLWI